MIDSRHDNGQVATAGLDVEKAVLDRYSSASTTSQPSLCCPVQYDEKLLDVLPKELIERGDRITRRGSTLRARHMLLTVRSSGGVVATGLGTRCAPP